MTEFPDGVRQRANGIIVYAEDLERSELTESEVIQGREFRVGYVERGHGEEPVDVVRRSSEKSDVVMRGIKRSKRGTKREVQGMNDVVVRGDRFDLGKCADESEIRDIISSTVEGAQVDPRGAGCGEP